MKKIFKTKLTWACSGEEFTATVKVLNSGWGEAYDKDGRYCGSINPMQTRELAEQGEAVEE